MSKKCEDLASTTKTLKLSKRKFTDREEVPLPLNKPRFIDELPEHLVNEPGIGIVYNGKSRFYPLYIISWCEVINDMIQGKRLSITYCPYTHTSCAFENLKLKSMPCLYDGNIILNDRTGKQIIQILRYDIANKQTCNDVISTFQVSYQNWVEMFPYTEVLDNPFNVKNIKVIKGGNKVADDYKPIVVCFHKILGDCVIREFANFSDPKILRSVHPKYNNTIFCMFMYKFAFSQFNLDKNDYPKIKTNSVKMVDALKKCKEDELVKRPKRKGLILPSVPESSSASEPKPESTPLKNKPKPESTPLKNKPKPEPTPPLKNKPKTEPKPIRSPKSRQALDIKKQVEKPIEPQKPPSKQQLEIPLQPTKSTIPQPIITKVETLLKPKPTGIAAIPRTYFKDDENESNESHFRFESELRESELTFQISRIEDKIKHILRNNDVK